MIDTILFNVKSILPRNQLEKVKRFHLFLWTVAFIGFTLVVWGAMNFAQDLPSWQYYFLALLLVVTSLASTSQEISNTSGVTWDVGTGGVLGSVAVFGLHGGILLAAFHTIGLWIVIPKDGKNWKKSFNQLLFNTGMQVISTTMGGIALLYFRDLWVDSLVLISTIPFFIGAVIDEGVNISLISMILKLQNGESFNLWTMLKRNSWAVQLTIITTSLCSILIAWAILNYNWLGISIFFVPSLLSAYAFRLYVINTQRNMDRLEELVAERTADLAALNRQKDAFLAVLTHDMLTPLSSIRLFTEIIQEDPDSIKADPTLTDTMYHSHKTLMNLVRNVLDIEKLESGKPIPSNKRPTNLSQILQDVTTTVQISAKRKQIDLSYRLHDPAIWLIGDSQQLERVFLNLLSNAVKYTPSEGSIEILTEVKRQEACIKISDTGYGIPEQDKDTIFEPYNRSEAHVDKESGMGLGLAIAKALIEDHQGSISIESEEEEGTTFSIVLPLSQVEINAA